MLVDVRVGVCGVWFVCPWLCCRYPPSTGAYLFTLIILGSPHRPPHLRRARGLFCYGRRLGCHRTNAARVLLYISTSSRGAERAVVGRRRTDGRLLPWRSRRRASACALSRGVLLASLPTIPLIHAAPAAVVLPHAAGCCASARASPGRRIRQRGGVDGRRRTERYTAAK